LTRWDVTSAQALSDAGYATGMWGKWHVGSDPESRSPVDFGCAWADGDVTPQALAELSTPDTPSLIVRFNPAGHAALLEV
jgi:arylsulfatase A-like enzyme